MEIVTISRKEEILQENLEHTIFSWSKQSGLNPLNIERAKGVYIYDRSGKKIIDFSSQLMNVNIGHGHPKVTEAVVKQMIDRRSGNILLVSSTGADLCAPYGSPYYVFQYATSKAAASLLHQQLTRADGAKSKDGRTIST